VIGLSPLLAYCAIFSAILSDSLICIFTFVCAAGTPLPRPRHLHSPVLFTGRVIRVMWSICCFVNDRTIYLLWRQTLLSEDPQCCESWRDAELGDRAVYPATELLRLAVRVGASHGVSDWRTAEFYVFFHLHRDTAVCSLANDTLITSDSNTSCYDDWR